MNGREPVDGSYFKKNLASHDNVHTLISQQVASVPHRKALLDLERNAFRLQLDADRAPVYALQQTRTEFSVHFDAVADHSMYQRFNVIVER